MILQKRQDIILLAGVPIEQWFNERSIKPTRRLYYSGMEGYEICLMTAIAIATFKDDRKRVERLIDEATDPILKTLAEAINVPYHWGIHLENGWGDRYPQGNCLRVMGFDAWCQVYGD